MVGSTSDSNDIDGALGRYHYQPLFDRHSLRLLDISGFAQQGTCALREFGASSCPPYTALSYTWGPPLATAECISEYDTIEMQLKLREDSISSLNMNIQKNLHDGLRQLALDQSITYLWVDAICINQEDIDERQAQVACMGDIYAGSEKVVVWLGQDNSNLDNFIWLHATLVPVLCEHASRHDLTALLKPGWSPLKLNSTFGVNVPQIVWTSYDEFFAQRRWFHRSWVFQEIALAPVITVFCGHIELNWDAMQFLAGFVHESGLGAQLGIERYLHNPRKVGYEISSLEYLRCQCKRIGQNARFGSTAFPQAELPGTETSEIECYTLFESCLRQIQDSQATDVRDKVFSAIGILNRFLPQGVAKEVLPDYSLTVEEAFRSVTYVLARKLPSLSFLSLVEDRSYRRLQGLPSWVPDFTCPITVQPLSYILHREIHQKSTSNSILLSSRCLSGSVLTLSGRPISTVMRTAAPWDETTISLDPSDTREQFIYNVLKFLQTLFLICSNSKHVHCERQSPLEAIWRVLIVNQRQLRQKTSVPITGKDFHDWVMKYMAEGSQFHKCNDGLFDSCMKLIKTVADDSFLSEEAVLELGNTLALMDKNPQEALNLKGQRSSIIEIQEGFDRYDSLFLPVQSHRRVFQTYECCLGVGPVSVEPEDQLWEIDSVMLPFILRPAENDQSFFLIGEAYLHNPNYDEAKDIHSESLWRPIRLL